VVKGNIKDRPATGQILSIRRQAKYKDAACYIEAALITAEHKKPQIYFLAKNRN